ncbi:glycosyltransferase [Ruegeria atlantica]|uniref:Poly-beta-1,6-N-acetyl-D-glucosamine synthase n=1 Tax=Ruegeria atlantica TaxID=81569 RepID=A0A0P1EG82_9RHOB|nr:glycosyltransferase [Ruegeria atlantica]CUH49074.1 Poly-beta-1,6-N-acetyl-D-glucosamine synthase [Ruegeria atlantica]
MPDIPQLSIVIPHLNAPGALRECLTALAEQADDGIAFEVIVVDNGSTETPDEICAAFPFARLAHETTLGPGPARSRGATLSRAEILAFIDCDCIAQSGWIAGIVDYFNAHPDTDVIGGDVRILRIDPNATTAVEAYESVYGYRMQLYIMRDGYAATCNMGVRRGAFRKVGDFAGITIAEDVDWGRRATSLGMITRYVPQIVVETQARGSFSELTRKWDRHIGHDFAEVSGIGGRLRWGTRALILAASPLGEVLRILHSDRVSGLRDRFLALFCLTRIRLYRCRRMLALLFGRAAQTATAWRQGS